MSYEDRRPSFNVSGVLQSGVSALDTSLTSTAFASLPTIYSNSVFMPLTIANDAAGTAEIVYVVGHAAASTSVTVVRGREGTTPKSFSAGDVVRCTPTVYDVQRVFGHLRLGTNYVFSGTLNTETLLPLDTASAVLTGGMSTASNGLVVPISDYYEVRVYAYATTTRAFGGRIRAAQNGGAAPLVDLRVTKAVANAIDAAEFVSQTAFLNAGDRVNLYAMTVWYDNNTGNINLYGTANAGNQASSLELIRL